VAKILSKLKIKRLNTLLLTIFYAIAGIGNVYMLALSNFNFMPVGAFAVLSFMAAYGLFKAKRWAVWIVIILFFPAATFGVLVLFFSVRVSGFSPSVEMLLFHLAFLFYVILSVVSFVYVAVKRKTFQ